MLGSATFPALASSGGSASAVAVHVVTANATILGVPLVTASDQTFVQASTPAPDATGNGSDVQQAGSLGQPGVFSSGIASAETRRTPAGLMATADVRQLGIGLLGADLVTAQDVSSSVSCPIVEGSGVPSATTTVVGLEVAGTPASPGAVDVPVAVPIAIPGVASAELLVDVLQTESTAATTADATALEVRATLRVLGPLGVELFNAEVLDMELAQTACAAPNAMAPSASDLDPDTGPIGTLVTMTGVGFVPGETTVQFGGHVIAAGSVDVADDGTELDFAVPAAATPGPVQVTATTPGGTTGPLPFTVTAGAVVPVADSLNPATGPVGTVVAVLGSGFIPNASAVDFGLFAIGAGDVLVQGPGTLLTFVVPAQAEPGPFPVTVTTAGGTTVPLSFTVTDGGDGGGGGDDGGRASCEAPGAILGTDGDDVLEGTPGDDVICGGKGDDVIRGLGGADVIVGGAGDDDLAGASGPDTLRGLGGSDGLRGERGSDRLVGGGGHDVLSGGAGSDVAKGGGGNDDLRGGGSRDVLRGGAGGDTLKGGAKADALNGGPGADVCNGGRVPRPVRKCETVRGRH
jgi:Ca2+-binding RTX toxin-like protein